MPAQFAQDEREITSETHSAPTYDEQREAIALRDRESIRQLP